MVVESCGRRISEISRNPLIADSRMAITRQRPKVFGTNSIVKKKKFSVRFPVEERDFDRIPLEYNVVYLLLLDFTPYGLSGPAIPFELHCHRWRPDPGTSNSLRVFKNILQNNFNEHWP